MPNGIQDALSSAPSIPVLQKLLLSSPAILTTTLTRAENTPQRPTSLPIRRKFHPYSATVKPQPPEPQTQPLDLSVKSASRLPLRAPQREQEPVPVPSTSRVEPASDKPCATKFLSIPAGERELMYKRMMMYATLITIPRESTGENISLEMRAAGVAYLSGIPVFHPLVIRDIADKTPLSFSRFQSAALHLSRAYRLQQFGNARN